MARMCEKFIYTVEELWWKVTETGSNAQGRGSLKGVLQKTKLFICPIPNFNVLCI